MNKKSICDRKPQFVLDFKSVFCSLWMIQNPQPNLISNVNSKILGFHQLSFTSSQEYVEVKIKYRTSNAKFLRSSRMQFI